MQSLQRTETLILYLFCQQKYKEPPSKVDYFSKMTKQKIRAAKNGLKIHMGF